MDPVSRRTFFASAATAASAARVQGANDRVRLGVIGTGGRGQHLIRMAQKAGGVEFVMVCDAWQTRARQARDLIGTPVAETGDYRRLLERKDVDAVIVATLDHTHSPITVGACLAGKDVFVEKPMTSVPMQGHEVVKAKKKSGRVVEVGVQQRSIQHFIDAKQQFVDTGKLGKVHMVRTLWNANGGYLTPTPPGMEQKPADLDWVAVLGWLPQIQWDPKRYFNRFAYWDFATGGQTGGLFVHMVDVVHWYLGQRRPISAVAQGGIYQYNDGRDTPDNVNFLLDYPGGVNVSFEATITDMLPAESADIVFFGEGGRLSIFRHRYKFMPADKGPVIEAKGTEEVAHMKNFLDCVRTRNEPNANCVDGHYSAMACHMGNMAYKEGRKVMWNSQWDVEA